MQSFTDLKFYLTAKREATKRCEEANRPERGWPQVSTRCEDPPSHGKCDRSRVERQHRKDSKNFRERRFLFDLLRDPGENKRVIVPALAPIYFTETTDVAVTGVGKKKS